MFEPYTPRSHQIYWCSHCDAVKVDSTLPETGKFHVRFGHQFNPNTKEYDGEYVGVMFAVCNPCDEQINKRRPAQETRA